MKNLLTQTSSPGLVISNDSVSAIVIVKSKFESTHREEYMFTFPNKLQGISG